MTRLTRRSQHLADSLAQLADAFRDNCFRDLPRETEVSVLPGILTFCFSGDVVRITSARRWEDSASAITRRQIHLAEGAATR